jgi:hypothetical protein
MEEIKFVDRKQIHWLEIQQRLKAEGIVFTVRRRDDYLARNSSGMGRIERLNYCFLLSYDGSAMLMITAPRSKRKKAAIERLVSLISEFEEVNLTRFPSFRNMIPAIDTAMKHLQNTRKQLPLPKPNLKYLVKQLRTLTYEWGCQYCAGRIEWLKDHFKGVEEFMV